MMIFPRTIKTNNSRIRGPCPPRGNNCKKVGHLAKDCRSRPANANNNNRNNNNNNQKGNGCYKCGTQGHFKRNCLKLKNNDRSNQAGNDRAPAKVYVVRNVGANPDNVVAAPKLTSRHLPEIQLFMSTDKSKITRKQSKHEQARARESEEYKKKP
ncbi:putative reverse transcriptase domain-containing protein [Tanacetum coccineum]